MKKIITVVLSFLLLVGCESMMNTPSKRVEEFLSKYQRQDEEIIFQLDSVLNQNVDDFNETQRDKYKELILRQYKDLTYIIKEENIDGNNATVAVEIEVYDYDKSLSSAEEYYLKNTEEFKDDLSIYVDYKLKSMENMSERIKYTLNLTLTRNDKKWEMNDITETDRLKIHGLYST